MSASDPVEIFRAEAQELFEQLEAALLDIESDPDNRDLIDSAFRALHTIKGSGAMFGFDQAASFTHHVENAFDLMRKGQLAATPELIGIALRAKDHIRILIDAPERADLFQGDMILGDLAAIVGGEAPRASERSAPAAAAPKPERTTYRLHIGLPLHTMLSGTNPLLLIEELRGLGECTLAAVTDAVPPIEEIDPHGCYLTWDGLLTTEQPRSAIDDVFLFVLDEMTLSVERVEVEAKLLGEILVERGVVAPEVVRGMLDGQQRLGNMLVQEGHISKDKLNAVLAEQGHLKSEQERTTKETAAIRVAADKLDELMDQVGELVIAQVRLKQMAERVGDLSLKSLVEEIERLSNHLRDTSTGIRMVQIGSLFSRFRRLVRDLSSELGKEVQLTWSGEETELDKTVIERLHDPLVHLIRNSIDHGVERPEDREKAGKPREGKVHLSASHAGAQVVIAISDDGKGLDRDRIRAKAEETGLLAPGAEISDTELFQLIFHPGFSTAAKITNVSGRGVGMDVVKRMIEALRGVIDISSRPGNGATFSLRLPLTLAIIDGLLVRVGSERYIIPLAAVEECIEISSERDLRSSGRDFLNIRGDLVPFVRLRSLFHIKGEPDPYQKVVVVSSGEFRFGLVVDQLLGGHQTVIKSLSKLHANVPTFSGATILGDGNVALILDVAKLLSFGQSFENQLKAS